MIGHLWPMQSSAGTGRNFNREAIAMSEVIWRSETINLGISFYFLVFGMFYKIIIFELRSVFYVIFIDVIYNLMEDLRLITYESPVAEVIEVMLEGIVCDSGEVPDMGHGWDLDF